MTKPTQTAKILRHLERHGSITPMLALNRFGCFRLAARIEELRKAGNIILTQRDKKRHFARYHMVG